MVKKWTTKVKHIALGFWYKFTGKHKCISNKRMAICNSCKYKDGSWCGICGCLLDAKTRVYKEHCPYDLW